MRILIVLLFFLPVTLVIAQPGITGEDLMLSDSANKLINKTTLGGYGNVLYQRNFNEETSNINLERFVIFLGHKFTGRISLFTELEFEDAKVEGGESGGEVALEQCFIRFNIDRNRFLVAGLFLPRLGILNENHLPTSFNGNERTMVETFVIPSTWRELGIGFYGRMRSYPVNYSLGIMNGLNSAGFEHGTLIRGGRYEGSNAAANNLAVTGALQWNRNSIKAQISGYAGGSVGLSSRESDSLQLEGGMFGTPVMLGEANVQYSKNGISVKVLGVFVSIPDASQINRAYSNNTPESGYGLYAEVGYDFLNKKTQQLIAFARYEKMDLNASISTNGIDDGTLDQSHIVAGLNYLPIANVTIKADVRLMHTEDENPALIINPSPTAPPYLNNNTFLNLGIGFSF